MEQESRQDVVLSAIKGLSIFKSVKKSPSVKRIVLTSSSGAVFDKSRDLGEPYTYTSEDLNPSNYEGAISAPNLPPHTEPRRSLQNRRFGTGCALHQASTRSGRSDCLLQADRAWTMDPSFDKLSSPNTSIQAHRDMVLGATGKLVRPTG